MLTLVNSKTLQAATIFSLLLLYSILGWAKLYIHQWYHSVYMKSRCAFKIWFLEMFVTPHTHTHTRQQNTTWVIIICVKWMVWDEPFSNYINILNYIIRIIYYVFVYYILVYMYLCGIKHIKRLGLTTLIYFHL